MPGSRQLPEAPGNYDPSVETKLVLDTEKTKWLTLSASQFLPAQHQALSEHGPDP